MESMHPYAPRFPDDRQLRDFWGDKAREEAKMMEEMNEAEGFQQDPHAPKEKAKPKWYGAIRIGVLQS